MSFYPFDDNEWDKFDKLGLQLVKKRDPEDQEYIVLRRPTKKLIRDDLVIFTPPEITGKVQVSYVNDDGEKVRQYNKGDKVNVRRVNGEGQEITGTIGKNDGNGQWENTDYIIGNESLVLVNFSYYDTQKGKGHRLENINVLEHVPFTGTTETTTDKVDEPKEELKVETKSKDLKNDLDDSIPW